MKKHVLAITLLFSCSFCLSVDKPKKEISAWYNFYTFFSSGAKEGAKKAVEETGKELLKDIILKPYLIKPIKKILGLDFDRGESEKRRIEFMLKLSRTIDELKKAGASKKQIAEMSAKLAEELNRILDSLNKKK